MATFIEISRAIAPGALVYPGDPPISHRRLSNITELHWTTHVLTHVDPPRHFIEGGLTVDQLPAELFVGEAVVVEVSGPSVEVEHITEPVRGRRVLFKTENSHRWDPSRYDENHVYVSGAAAAELVSRGAVLVGIDYLSIDRFGDEEYPAHHTLLRAGIPIVEGLDLSKVDPGLYTLIALPLRIQDGDGSPVRAILIRNDH